MEITIRNLEKDYGQREILRIPEYTFSGGGIHQLSGANGAGKSTLFEILSLLDKKYRGTVTFDGRDIREIPPDGKTVTQVFQKPVMLGRSVKENLIFPLKIQGVGDEAIEQELSFYLDYLPLDLLMTQKGTSLSSGEAQKVSLIRGLLLKTPILLLDEPFSAMDRASREKSLQMIMAHHRRYQPTILIISHREMEHPMMEITQLERGTLMI